MEADALILTEAARGVSCTAILRGGDCRGLRLMLLRGAWIGGIGGRRAAWLGSSASRHAAGVLTSWRRDGGAAMTAPVNAAARGASAPLV